MLIVGNEFHQVLFLYEKTTKILKDSEIRGIAGMLRYETEKILNSKANGCELKSGITTKEVL